jgi:hypothetical protein
MVLYAYVCVCAFSLRRESPNRILGDKPLLFQGGSVIILPLAASQSLKHQAPGNSQSCRCLMIETRNK